MIDDIYKQIRTENRIKSVEVWTEHHVHAEAGQKSNF